MNGDAFNADPFDSLTQESNGSTLEKALRQFEKKYFSGVTPVTNLEVTHLDGPARLWIKSRTIQINSTVSNYPRVARLPNFGTFS